MLVLSSQALSQIPNISSISSFTPSDNQFKWKIIIRKEDGGFKRLLFMGQDDNPISSINFELNQFVCGSGFLGLAFVDFPVHPEDYIEIYHEDDIKYRGILENSTDPKGGRINLIPYKQRFDETLINNTFSAQTISAIFQTIVEAVEDDTKIIWNPAFVDTGSSETFTLDYSGYEKPKKIFDELINKLDDREWGVTPENIFTVYQPNESIDQKFFQDNSPFMSEARIDRDTSNVFATRLQVFKKQSGAGEVARIGEVGYGGSYPIIALESQIRKKEEKFNVSELITDDNEALDIAYAHLTSQIIPLSIGLQNCDIRQYFPVIGDKLLVQDRNELILRTIIDCNTATGWTGGALDTSDSVEGTGSIQFSGTGSPTAIIFDFGKVERWFNTQKIGFMIKSTVAGNYLEFSTGETKSGGYSLNEYGLEAYGVGSSTSSDLWDTVYPVNIFTNGLWQWHELEFSGNFRYFGLRFSATQTATVNIDQVSLFLYNREEYESNIVKVNFTIDSQGDRCDVTLNQYELQANDEIFAINRRLDKLNAIQQQ